MPTEDRRWRRTRFAIALAAIVVVEVLIGLFVHDAFVRPYLGDVLAAIGCCCLARVIVPTGVRLLPLAVLAFTVLVEVLQGIDILGLLGVGTSSALRVLAGSVFDWSDIACYAVGCALFAVIEWRLRLFE